MNAPRNYLPRSMWKDNLEKINTKEQDEGVFWCFARHLSKGNAIGTPR